MKKTTKNPITFFREANEKRQAAVKKSLRKAQDGIIAGPKTEAQTMMESSFRPSDDPMAYGRGPRTTSPRQDRVPQMDSTDRSKRYGEYIKNIEIDDALTKKMMQNAIKQAKQNIKTQQQPAEMYKMTPTGERYKKGGSVKPSAGLSKKTKSNIAKKASAGKDIGKKGKGFAKVAAAAGGGEKGKRIAAAAMWKNIKRG